MSEVEINLTVNGRSVQSSVEPRTHLADFLREQLLLTGTHLGCEQGVCGACTVMINGRPSRSCITLAASCDAADIRTIESFDDDPLMVKLRDAFSEHHGLQCGFCTPGLLTTAYDVVRRVPDADASKIRKELSGNLCRCTGYQGAVQAVEHVIATNPPKAELQPGPHTQPRIGAASTVNTAPDTPAPTSTNVSLPDEIKDGIKLERRIEIAAPADKVWDVLSDIKGIAECVPGGSITRVEGSVVEGLMTVGLGPMRANFQGAANVTFDPATQSGKLLGRGGDRLTRSNVDGEMTFQLHTTSADRSELELNILYKLKGPLAQFGRPAIVSEVADKILADTAASIAAKATGNEHASATQKPAGGLTLLWSALLGMFKGFFRR